MIDDLYRALAHHMGMEHLNASEDGRVTLQFESGDRLRFDVKECGLQISLLMPTDPVHKAKQQLKALALSPNDLLSQYALRPGLVGQQFIAFHVLLSESQMQLDHVLLVMDEIREHGKRLERAMQ